MKPARAKPSNDDALAAMIAKKAEIDAMLKRLVEFSGDHFGVNPSEVTWGTAATAAELALKLRRATDWAFGEGENA